MINRCKKGFLVKLLTVGTLMSSFQLAYAGGFQLWEENSGSLGTNHAGAAAEANSAADEFYNPAGIVRAKQMQVSVGGTLIDFNTQFKNGFFIMANTPIPIGKDIKGGTLNVVPNAHIVMPLSSRWFAALGVTVPFGLATSYSSTEIEAAFATDTNINAININPSLAFIITPHLSIGAGFNALYGSADYDSATLANHLTGWGYGVNAGILYQLNKHTRMGVSYRSQITVDASGLSKSPGNPSTTAKATLPLPATTMLSIYHDFSQHWSVMTSVFYSQWNVFKTLQLKKTALPGAIVQTMNFKNTWNFSLGSSYQLNRQWTIQCGVGYDQTPTQNGHRDIRLPDADHYTVTTGAHFQATSRLSFDIGYAHLFTPKAAIDGTVVTPPPFGIIGVTGHSVGGANLFSFQTSMLFN